MGAVHGAPHVGTDVHDVAPTRRAQPDLAHVALERAAGRRGRAGFEGILATRRPTQVLLDAQQVVPSALDDSEQLGH